MLRSKDTIKYWKGKFWAAMSLYIRTRDCIETTGDSNKGKCCTCETEYPKTKLQAGHFIPGRNNAVMTDERGIHAQCYNCNINLKGSPRKYDHFMRIRYGDEVVEELDQASNKSVVMKWFDWKEKYEEVLEKIGALNI